MIKKSKSALKIPIDNIFAMLSYAYPDLVNDTLEETEHMFDSLDELLAEILLQGITRQLRRGLYKTYVPHEEALTVIRGKIDMHDSIRLNTQLSRQLYCRFDEFDKNNFYNQVLKTSSLLIIRRGRVCQKTRKRIRDMLFFFNEIDEIKLATVCWEEIRFHKDKIAYRSLISLCYLIYRGMSEDEETGQSYLTELAISDLYARFLQHFYLEECPQLHLSYQGKSLASMQERATGMKSAQTIDMILTDPQVIGLMNNHYYGELIEKSKNPDSELFIYENMKKLVGGLKRIGDRQKKLAVKNEKRLLGVLLYPSLEENYLEEYPVPFYRLYIGAIDLTLPFKYIRKQLIQVAMLDRNY